MRRAVPAALFVVLLAGCGREEQPLLSHGNTERFRASDLRRGIADRQTVRLHCTAPDEGFQAFAREGRDRGCERAVEAPARMGDIQAHVDRLNFPHS